MKIVYNIPSIVRMAGMERILAIKANYLALQKNIEVVIITYEQKNQPLAFDFSDKIRFYDLGINYTKCQGTNIFWNKIRRMRYIARHKKRLTEILAAEKPDITISMMSGREREWLYKLKDGSKKVLECHFSYYWYRDIKGLIDRYKISRFIGRIAHYDRFVVLTEEDRKDWGTRENIMVIPNALTFYPQQQADLSQKRVIAVGRLREQKRFDRLINIWAKIEPHFPDWRLTIIGSGELQGDLERQIRTLGLKQIEILPPHTDIVKDYLNSSIYAMTSQYEGFPMVLHEAMSCGLPVVTYTCKCGPRDIIQEGEDGFLVEEGNEAEFIKRLQELMNDFHLRQRMGEAARRNIIRFDLPSVMLKWESLFTALLRNERSI